MERIRPVSIFLLLTELFVATLITGKSQRIGTSTSTCQPACVKVILGMFFSLEEWAVALQVHESEKAGKKNATGFSLIHLNL